MIDTPMLLVEGEPFELTATVTGGATTFSGGHQVYGQARNRVGGTVMRDFSADLSSAVSGSDIVVTLSLSGADVRAMAAVAKSGLYDIFIAEPGVDQVQAIRIVKGPVAIEPVITPAPTTT